MIVETTRKQMRIIVALSAFVLIFPIRLYAGEEDNGHRPCNLCHEMEGKKAKKVKIEPDTETVNPFTGNPYGPVDGICVRCHTKFTHKEGHVLGIRPEKINVPDECMGYKGQEGELTCLACHNPHPGRTQYKFLRWRIADESEIEKLCVRCHSDKAPRNHSSG
jgi:predicted CXXCH cytochrome family protein